MTLKKIHRKIAQAVAEAAYDIEGIAHKFGIKAGTVRRWLARPDVRGLIRQLEREERERMRRLAVRWGPSAAIRLIQDLRSESASEARQAAQAILRLACAFAGAREDDEPEPARLRQGYGGQAEGPPPARLDSDQAEQILEILAGKNSV